MAKYTVLMTETIQYYATVEADDADSAREYATENVAEDPADDTQEFVGVMEREAKVLGEVK